MNDKQIKEELARQLGGEWRKLRLSLWGGGNRRVRVEPTGEAGMLLMGEILMFDSIAQLADRLRVLRDSLATIPDKPPIPKPVVVERDGDHPVTVAIAPRLHLLQLQFTDDYNTRNFTPNEWDRVVEAAAPMVAWIREHGEG